MPYTVSFSVIKGQSHETRITSRISFSRLARSLSVIKGVLTQLDHMYYFSLLSAPYLYLFIKKIIFFDPNCNLPIPRPPQRTPKLQAKPSALKREHQHLKTWIFLTFFSCFVDHFCPPGSGSNPGLDLDPQQKN